MDGNVVDSPTNVRSAVDFFNSLTRKKYDSPPAFDAKPKREQKQSNTGNCNDNYSRNQDYRPRPLMTQTLQLSVNKGPKVNEVTNDNERTSLMENSKNQTLEFFQQKQIVYSVTNDSGNSGNNAGSLTKILLESEKKSVQISDKTKLLSDDSENEQLQGLIQLKPKYKRNRRKYDVKINPSECKQISRSFDNTPMNKSTSNSSNNKHTNADDKISTINETLSTNRNFTPTILNNASCQNDKNSNEEGQQEQQFSLSDEHKESASEIPLDLINLQTPSFPKKVKVTPDRKLSCEEHKRNDQLSMTCLRDSQCDGESLESSTKKGDIRECIEKFEYQMYNRNLPDVALKTNSNKLNEIDKEHGLSKHRLRRRVSSPRAFYRKTSISEYLNKTLHQRISDFQPDKNFSDDNTDETKPLFGVKVFNFTTTTSEKITKEIEIKVGDSKFKNKPQVPPRSLKGNETFHSKSVVLSENVPQLDKPKRNTVDYAGLRSDVFLESYLHGIGDRQSSPVVGDTSLSPPPCRIAPCLLPAPASRSLSRESLVSSNGGGSDAGSEDSTDTGYGATCDINLVERLIRSHPIWFLPGIQRAGAFHLLQGKEEGCFVVRQSSQADTMALSVRLPPDKGPYIEHYLIQSCEGRLGLETSENRFDNMPALIAHYANCCDELPVQLTLPKAIREAKSRQQLSSLALLGQEFWRYSPPPSASSSPDVDLVLNPLLSSFKKTESSTRIEDAPKPIRPNTLNLVTNVDAQKMDTVPVKNTPLSAKAELSKVPPPPPPRWSKPTTPQSNFGTPQNNFTVTTTVTFSVKPESPRNELPPSQMEVVCDPKRMSPEGQCHSTVSSKDNSLRRGPDQVVSPNGSILSPLSDPSSILSPDTLSPLSVTKTGRHSKRSKHKISKHYQESDILDSPTVYYRSAVGDKVSDYEDLWTNEHSTFKPRNYNNNINNNNCNNLPSPDLLQHTQNVVSLNNNVLSPADSHSGSQRSHCSTPVVNVSIQNSQNSIQLPVGDTPKNPEAKDSGNGQSPKQSSPFYAEPADSLTSIAVPRRFIGRSLLPMQQRHSNPPALLLHSSLSPGLERIDSPELNGTISSSVGNLSPKQKPVPLKKPEVKAVQPPFVKTKPNENWTIDNSWKFLLNENEASMDLSDADYDSDWPSGPPHLPLSPHACDADDRITIQDLIARRFPDIRTSTEITTDEDISRMSAYDNVDDKTIPRAPPSEISELTEFSDPWNEVNQGFVCTETDDTLSETCNQPSRTTSVVESKLLAAPRLQALRNREQGYNAVGSTIRQYALELSKDKSTTFAQNIDNFIACTCESKESNPQVVMRNMRQFMSGMKNYLVKHGEKGFNKEVEKERNKLKSTEFLNLDAILEGVMHKLVVRPLKAHLQKLFVDYYTKTGAIKLLAENIQYATTRPISELAVKPKIGLPSEAALLTISQYITRLQAADSPLEKLEYLLASIATIFNSVKSSQISGSGKPIILGADDFLPLFVWVLVKTNFVAAEIEAEYMWGLLHPSLLSGEGGYYLTTLSSAVHVLKSFKENGEENSTNNIKNDSVLKVIVPDELHGSILTKTLPARPHMTTKEVCKIIAHKARITNPQDYALYRLVDGEETILGDNECPQDFMPEGRHVRLAYKRIDAKIAWPKQQSN